MNERKMRDYNPQHWGNCKPLEFSFKDSGGNKARNKAAKTISSLFHRFNRIFKQIKKCNLNKGIKEVVMLDLIHKYKKSIFEDIQSPRITDQDKRAIFYYVITKYRKWRTK